MTRHLVAALLAGLVGVAGVGAPAPLAAQPAPRPAADGSVPSFAELEAAGARVGEIRILNQDIFDLEDPKENNALFRLANRIHGTTHPGVIRGALLFRPGERLSVRLIEETERLLRDNRFLYEVRLRPVAYHDGVADIEVLTRDTWSLDPGVSFGRSGGANTSSFGLQEYNLGGLGLSLGLAHSSQVDRSSNEFEIQYPRAFDGWTTVSFGTANNSDGHRQSASVVRPFYALDARWAAGATVSKDDRIDPVYTAGVVASQYRHRQNKAEVFGGWSPGLVQGWTRRYTLGLTALDDAYQTEPRLVAPLKLPTDQKLVSPFVRYELIEDDFRKRGNRNQMGRPEFFAMGFTSRLQLGRALTALGSSQDLWLYAASVSNGFNPAADHELLTSASISGQYGDGQVRRQLASAAARYYLPLNKRFLLYGFVGADVLKNPDLPDLLPLGGDNGLRGYPLRYQTGQRRALVTLETRAYSDLYLWQLFRVGGAAFYDVGRAWGGANTNPANPGWLGNVGFGLRIFSVRAAFGNVLHMDVAVPLDRTPGIKPVQFLLKTKASF